MIKKAMAEIKMLLKENDVLTRKFREKGQNVSNFRNYLKTS